jgi:hypothetical protein
MEVKFQNLINQHGVSIEQTTIKIKSLKNNFDEAWSSYQEILENYHNCKDVDEKQILMDEINEFEADLQKADEELVKKINEWVKNKDKWEENKRKMAEGRARKAAESSSNRDITQRTLKEIEKQSEALQNPIIPQEVGNYVSADGGIVKEKKSSNMGWWIFAGFVTAVTLGSVVMKRR